jgi:hypothetical protein
MNEFPGRCCKIFGSLIAQGPIFDYHEYRNKDVVASFRDEEAIFAQ